MLDICPTTGRPVRLYFAPSVDHSTARMIYFAIGDKIYPGMYAISSHEWEHDSGNESDSSLTLFQLEEEQQCLKIIEFSRLVEFQTI